MDVEKILAQLVRIGTVTSADPVKRVARVKFQDTGMTSGQLYVLASRSYIPDYETKPQRTEFEAGGSGDPAFASHKHDLLIKPWMPKVNAVVLCIYLPGFNTDGYILGEIGALGGLKQME
jgi:hypothetical protein